MVRQLRIRELRRMQECLDDAARFIELVCDRPERSVDTLTLDSCERLVAEGKRLNWDFFARWWQRRLDRQERLLPGITDQMVRNAGLVAVPGSPSTSGWPKPPSGADSPSPKPAIVPLPS